MKPQIYRKLFFCPVQKNQNDASVCIFICNRLYLICVYRMGDPHASGTQIMRDVIKTVKGPAGGAAVSFLYGKDRERDSNFQHN